MRDDARKLLQGRLTSGLALLTAVFGFAHK